MKLKWLTDEARQFLDGSYIFNQTPEERYVEIADTFEKISKIEGFSKKVQGYIEKGWVSFASPVLSNFGKEKGLPASCNMGKVHDTLESILHGMYEMGMLAGNGAGTAKNFTPIREKYARYGDNGKSEGVMSWIENYEQVIKKVSQGGVRRGFLTAYLSVSHPEINDFIQIGSEGHKLQKITTGVTIPKGWMESMLEGDKEKQQIFVAIHEARNDRGYPYILFEDNCNKGKHKVYVDKDLWLDTSNICSECVEYVSEDKEFTCVLSSANLIHYDEFKNTDFIFDLNIMLDCVVEEYVQKGKKIKGLERSVKFAEEHRAIGVGTMGLFSYFQKNKIVFGSMDSFRKNYEIFSYIRKESDRASKWMAEEWGEPKMLRGYGGRNTSRIAIAPTKSTSFVMGNPSLGIEPIKSNYHVKDLAKIFSEYKNPELIKVLEEKGHNTEDVWQSISKMNGSVQHLYFLSEEEKQLFMTFEEISPMDVIKLAGQRQQFIDQSQSLNLMIPNSATPKEIINLSIEAWKLGIKTLYYQYTVNAAQNLRKSILTCTTCEG